MKNDTRKKKIIRTGILGIAVNLLLAAFKLTVGLLSHSIAIVSDGVNNASDVLSSLVTVAGAKMADRPADREHPLGHGRMEYISAEIVSAVILYAGMTALIESVKRMIHPVTPEYSELTMIVVGVSVAVKLTLGIFVTRQGRILKSDALGNSGKDALWDSLISAATFVAAVVFIITGVELEAWLGALISLVIIRSGVNMFRRTASKILGERVDSGLSRAVKETICETDGVLGAYDLILSSYGYERWIGSVNIEVPDTWTADEIDTVSREICDRVARENGVVLSSIGIYSHNSTSDEAKQMRTAITEAVMSKEYVLQIHGFRCDLGARSIRFDLVTDFKAPDKESVYDNVLGEVRRLYPDFEVSIHHDSDYSD